MKAKSSSLRLVKRRIDAITIALVFGGVLISYVYLAVIDPLPTGTEVLRNLDLFGLLVTNLIVVAMYVAGALWSRRYDRRIDYWFDRLSEGATITDLPEHVRSDVLNTPARGAGLSLFMWFAAGIIFSFLTQSPKAFVALAMVAGLLTSVTLYFAVDLIWQPIIPTFFPEGRLSATKAFRLHVLGKLLTVFLLIGIIPPAVLVSVSWTRAQLLLAAPNPETVLENLLVTQFFILATGILASIGLAVFMTRTITQPLGALQEGMEQVEDNNFDIRIPVTSNDELGYLSERMNEMTAGLKEGELLKETQRKLEQELAIAWGIQSSFLPRDRPVIPGWQVSATLEPARQTSGDFYDFFSLPGGKYGVLVADVADKGTGAALYMAMSRTVLRTYAYEYTDHPAVVLEVANRRILADSGSDLFVTVFYAVLDPDQGHLVYCNAGHNPPFLFYAAVDRGADALTNTGIPLGMFEDMHWEERSVQVAPGDLLVMYTDGVTEAQRDDGDLFGEQRLIATVQAHQQQPAGTVQEVLLSTVRAFMGNAPQFDDITLMLLARKINQPAMPGT